MPRNQTALSPVKETKAYRGIRAANKTPALARPAPAPVTEFDVATYRKEIAQLAYRIWLERADRPGSPEADWAKAEGEVRAKYAR
jgi:hypothetical protein